MPVRHAKVSGKAAPTDTTLVGGPDWDAEHNAPPVSFSVFRDGSTALIITNIPAALTEFPAGAQRARTRQDLTHVSQARIVIGQNVAANAAAEIRVQYSPNQVDWAYLDGTSGPTTGPLGTTAGRTLDGPWVTLVAAAKSDVFLRCITINGDGAADPSFFFVDLQLR